MPFAGGVSDQGTAPGIVILGASRWKRRFLRRFFGLVAFENDSSQAVALARKTGVPLAVWASKEPDDLAEICQANGVKLLHIEDGFIRSRGLGAELFEPISLVVDSQGIYFDPRKPCDLEDFIRASVTLTAVELERARKLRLKICSQNISKYNVGADLPTLVTHGKRRILVPGQVEDDASIVLGSDAVRTNGELLKIVRRDNPEAFIAYKPHPDVEAGLRTGSVSLADLAAADVVLTGVSATAAIAHVDEVWTMTSLIGFEALLRGKKVVTFGTPFYAGWGLSDDRGKPCPRRNVHVSLDGLVHAAFINYPTYRDMRSAEPISVEQALVFVGASRRNFWLVTAVFAQKILRRFRLKMRR